MLHLEDPRFREHPTFILFVTNIYLRHQCLQVGTVTYNQACEKLTVKQLQEKFAQQDPEVMNNLSYFARNIPGTAQHFQAKTNEILAMNDHLRYSSNDTKMFNVFQVSMTCEILLFSA